MVVVVVAAAGLTASSLLPRGLSPGAAPALPGTATPEPGGGPVPTPVAPGQVIQMGMGPFQVPPAPTAVTGYYDAAQRLLGAQVYEQRCSTCHGDVGQGLTAEWRATWPEGKQNCWQSKCHGGNHPPDGFSFPKVVPALIGGSSLTRFATGQDLFNYIVGRMPFHAPGTLGADNYWALTAFLLDAHRIPYTGRVLDAATAGSIRLRQAAAPAAGALDWRAGVLLGAGLLAAVGLAVWWRATRRRSAGRQVSGPE